MNRATRNAAELFTDGRYEEAARAGRQALSTDPENLDLLNLLALAEAHLGEFDAAEDALKNALNAAPATDAVLANLENSMGYVALQRGDSDAAVTAFQMALDRCPQHVEANFNLGCTVQETDAKRAGDAYRTVLSVAPDHQGALNNLGSLLLAQNDLEQATALYRQAVSAHPGDTLSLRNLAKAHRHAGNLKEALSLFDQAIRVAPRDPEIQFGRALTLLTAGDYRAGWPAYRWRYQVDGNPRRHADLPEWKGQALRGQTVLTHTEQGFGDALQFARFVPEAAARGAKVILECPAPLTRLFSSISGVDRVLSRGSKPPAVDFQVPLLELPGLFDAGLDDLPSSPYLSAAVSDTPRLPPGDRRRMRVGVVLGTKSRTPGSDTKSLELNTASRIVSSPYIDAFLLQVDATEAERTRYRMAGATDLTQQIDDFADTAALIEQMDLTIAVDTAVAHLAGAIGKPVWILLHAYPDWRWLTDREDSPWYPTARLFRQPTPGDWAGVGEQVCAALERLAS